MTPLPFPDDSYWPQIQRQTHMNDIAILFVSKKWPQSHPNKKHRTVKLLYRNTETVKTIKCEYRKGRNIILFSRWSFTWTLLFVKENSSICECMHAKLIEGTSVSLKDWNQTLLKENTWRNLKTIIPSNKGLHSPHLQPCPPCNWLTLAVVSHPLHCGSSLMNGAMSGTTNLLQTG